MTLLVTAFRLVTTGLIGLLLPFAATAQAWRPQGPVTIVVPYSVASGADNLTRPLARALEKIWGRPVVVENLPGAEGLIGSQRVVNSKPDGHTLLMNITSIVLTKHVPGLKGADPQSQLTPIGAFGEGPVALVGSGKLAANTLAEAIDHCRQTSKPCSIAGSANMSKLGARQLASDAGIPNLILVSYSSSANQLMDLINGITTLGFYGLSPIIQHQRSGALKVFAIAGPNRYAGMPDVPTTAEAGLPSFQYSFWYGLFGPSAMPAKVRDGIAVALKAATQESVLREGLATSGASPLYADSAKFAAHLSDATKRYDDLVAKYPLQ